MQPCLTYQHLISLGSMGGGIGLQPIDLLEALRLYIEVSHLLALLGRGQRLWPDQLQPGGARLDRRPATCVSSIKSSHRLGRRAEQDRDSAGSLADG